MGNLLSNPAEEIRKRAEETRRQQVAQQELRRQTLNRQYEIQQRQRQLENQREFERQRWLERQSALISAIRQSNDTIYSRPSAGYSTHGVLVANYIITHKSINDWNPMTRNETVKFVKLLSTSQEYRKIERMFKSTNKSYFKVSDIERIQNPFLYGEYLLKKEEHLSRYKSTEEMLLFHGTKEHNIDNICENNFDWRQHGSGTGHRFGRGVSFSPISNYATHYCDKYSSVKVMLVVKVLISQSCVGNAEMNVPPLGFDTTHKDNGHVIVKYDDNEFYPAYKLYYTS